MRFPKHSTEDPDNIWWFGVLGVLLVMIGIAIGQVTGIPTPQCRKYMSTPDLMWTRKGGVHCMAWRMPSSMYFYQCDNDTNGVVAYGALFDDLHSVP